MATGGIGSYMLQMAELLHENNWKITVISSTNGIERKELRSFGVNFLVKAIDDNEFRKKALQCFDENLLFDEIDLIESPEVGACGLEIKKKYPYIPLVVKMHTPGVLITKVSNTYQPLAEKIRFVAGSFLGGKVDLGYWRKVDKNRFQDPEFQICKIADYLLSPSEALKNWAVSYWLFSSEKIMVLENPYKPSVSRGNPNSDNRKKQICFVGKLTVLKGMYTFTDALLQILLKYPEYKAVFIGRDEPVSTDNPSMKVWMQDKLKDVSTRVNFTGVLKREEVNRYLKESQIAVFPSLWENYPMVILEAMSAGVAVAASNRGGIPEIINNGSNGILFDPSSIKSIKNNLEKLIACDQFRIKLATSGYDWIHVKHAFESAASIIKTYRNFLTNYYENRTFS